jgi:hypothetical protein
MVDPLLAFLPCLLSFFLTHTLPFLSQVDPAKFKPGFETPSNVLRNNVLSFL